MDLNNSINEIKYLKYKTKYNQLKNIQEGGTSTNKESIEDTFSSMFKKLSELSFKLDEIKKGVEDFNILENNSSIGGIGFRSEELMIIDKFKKLVIDKHNILINRFN